MGWMVREAALLQLQDLTSCTGAQERKWLLFRKFSLISRSKAGVVGGTLGGLAVLALISFCVCHHHSGRFDSYGSNGGYGNSGYERYQ
jgi:hypothetical protein